MQETSNHLDLQHVVQAYMWAAPLVATEAVRAAALRTDGIDRNAIAIVADHADLRRLTGQNPSLYARVFIDLDRDGPVVIYSPEGVYGIVHDSWRRPVVEIGPFGPDKGRGGRYLLLPPTCEGVGPAGYITARAATNRVIYFGRSVLAGDEMNSPARTLARIRVHPLWQGPRTPPIVACENAPSESTMPRGLEYWSLLSAGLVDEPSRPLDRRFRAILKPLGIEQGKPFAPNARQRAMLTEAANVGFVIARAFEMPRLSRAPGYPGTQWEWVSSRRCDGDGSISHRMGAVRAKGSACLEGSRTYSLHVPACVPVAAHWSVWVHDSVTGSIVQSDSDKPYVDSREPLVVNRDGSVDLHFGPSAAPRHCGNWIQTVPDQPWFAHFLWHQPTSSFYNRTWTLPDIEEA
jgi:hypothetical protein